MNGVIVNIHHGYVTPMTMDEPCYLSRTNRKRNGQANVRNNCIQSQLDLSHFFSFVCKISSLHTFHPLRAVVSVCGELFQASQVPLAKAQQAVQWAANIWNGANSAFRASHRKWSQGNRVPRFYRQASIKRCWVGLKKSQRIAHSQTNLPTLDHSSVLSDR